MTELERALEANKAAGQMIAKRMNSLFDGVAVADRDNDQINFLHDLINKIVTTTMILMHEIREAKNVD